MITQVARVMQMAHWHTYQVLTKRAEYMREMLAGPLAFAASLEHIWWGVSVEDRKYGVPRIESLRRAPAALRFLSIEPLLEELGEIDLSGIDWVIGGGESGPGARPMQPEWVRNIRQQCAAAKVPFFFKQWGGVKESEAGRELDGRTFDDMPERSVARVPSHRVRLTLMEKVRQWEAEHGLTDPVATAGTSSGSRQPLLF